MKKPINEIERLKLMAGLINEVEYNDSVYGVKRTTLTEGKKKKEVKELSIDVANPYEYRMGLQYELEQMDDYSNESLEKAKSIVLKNLAKDVNFYTTLLNQDQSPYKFEAPETDAPGMQARPDGFLKKELKKDAKANVQDTLGKKEAGKKKPKGVKVMPDKGVEGKEKVVKENVEEVLPGVDLGASFEKMKGGMNVEDEFESLVKKYDWYAEMSDDSRKWDAQQAMEAKLRQLAKTIGIDKAVEIFNRYAPSDRKVTSDHSMWMNEDKHSKIKEALKSALKKALKEEDPAMIKLDRDEETKERELAAILKKKADLLNKPGTQG